MAVIKQKGSNKKTGLCQLRLEDEMSIYTAHATSASLSEFFAGYSDFELDLSGVTDFDSAGVQILLVFQRAAEKAGKKMRVIASNDVVQDVLQLYRLADEYITEQPENTVSNRGQ